MTGSRRIFELAKRDFVTRARSRAFVVSMLVIVTLIAGIGPLLAFAADEDTPSATVGVVTGAPTSFPAVLQAQGEAVGIVIRMRSHATAADGERALEDGETAALVNGTEIVWRDEPWGTLQAAIASAIQLTARANVAAELGLSEQESRRLFDPVPITERRIVAENPETEPRQIAALVGMIMLYISIIMFGQFVLMGVMEEKQNRVVEVVLSRATPVQVLTAKILGIGLLGLIQLIVIGAAALFTVNLVDIADVDLGAISFDILIAVIGWYLLGYAFYSVMYGGLGATVSRQEDMQGIVMLPVLFILPGFFIAQIGMVEPDLLLVRIASWLPIWSPMVMAVRSAVSAVPVWEIALSVLLVIAATIGMVRVAARIYTGAVLRLGRKVRLRDAWRAAAD